MTNTNVITVSESADFTVISLRDELAEEIRSHLDNIGTSYLAVGKALIEARGDFDKQPEFLEWVSNEFGIQKSQAFRLMQVGRVFGDDTRFSGVAMRVLTALAPHVDDKAVIERAAAAAAEGKLNTAAITAILAPATLPPKTNGNGAATPAPASPPKLAGNEGASTTPPAQQVPDEVEAGEAEAKLSVGDVAPHDVVIEGEVVEASPLGVGISERERGLLAMVETLKDTIKNLQDEFRRRDTARDTKVKAAPALPQFKSSCLYARLGLSAEEAQDVKKVKKAQRELVKLGYGDGHDSWPAIVEAVEGLSK